MIKNFTINYTLFCTNNCKHCYLTKEERKNAKFLSKENIDVVYKKICNYLIPYMKKNKEKIYNEVKIFYYGGEPLLLDYEILEYSFKKFDKFKNKYLQTSLVPLFDKNYEERKKYYELFKKYNLKLGTSYDFFGIRTYRGSEELYEKKLLEIVKELNDCNLGVDLKFSITKYVKGKENLVYRWLLKNKKFFSSISYMEYMYYSIKEANKYLYLTNKEISEILIEFFLLDEKNKIIDNLQVIVNGVKNNHKLDCRMYSTCQEDSLTINFDGEIVTCDIMLGKEEFGNIYKEEIKDVLKSKNKIKWFVLQNKRLNICNSCEFKNICNPCPLKKNIFINNKINDKNQCPGYYPFLKYIKSYYNLK